MRLLTIDRPNVIDETIDGETVVIDLRTGFYFALNATATQIWHLLEAGTTDGAVVDTLASVYEDADRVAIEDTVRSFLGELESSKLVKEIGLDQAPGDARLLAPEAGASFIAPTMDRYTDMHDIILLDPVHQIDERGWPHARTSDVASARE